MKVQLFHEIKNCYDCPFAVKIYQQGYSSTDCSKLGAYSTIPKKGIHKNCPFKNETLNKKEEI